MQCEVISKFEDKTFCDIGIDLTTSELGSSPVKNYGAASWIYPSWPFSFPRVRRAAFDSEQFVGGFCNWRVLGRSVRPHPFRFKGLSLTSSGFCNSESPQKLGGVRGGLLERFKEVSGTARDKHTVQLMLPIQYGTICIRCGVNEAFWSSTWCRECLDAYLDE